MCQKDIAVQHKRLGTWGTHRGRHLLWHKCIKGLRAPSPPSLLSAVQSDQPGFSDVICPCVVFQVPVTRELYQPQQKTVGKQNKENQNQDKQEERDKFRGNCFLFNAHQAPGSLPHYLEFSQPWGHVASENLLKASSDFSKAIQPSCWTYRF